MTVCSWKPNVMMVWAWMLCSWSGHGCAGDDVLLEHECCSGLGMDARERRLLEHESY